jgi:hypothetical protein
MAPAKLSALDAMASLLLTPRSLLQRSLPVLPLLLVAAALGCAQLLSSSEPVMPRNAAISAIASPIYDAPGAQAQQHAVDFLGDIDKAVANGVAVLRGGDGKSIVAQGRYFNALVNAGYAQFGSSYYDPLGSCGAAGSSARHLWHTQVRALHDGASSGLAAELRKAGETLEKDRRTCLAAVRPTLVGSNDWQPVELASMRVAPAWSPPAAWPGKSSGRSSTNL